MNRATQKLDYNTVIQGNIAVHKVEASFYDVIHGEIFNGREQKRLSNTLSFLTKNMSGCQYKAVDFGAGTGNVTKKLLGLGYEVTAFDISPEMCARLEAENRVQVTEGRLKVLNLNLDKSGYKGQFDLVTCYSVLHHLPDHENTIGILAKLVKPSGILYIDHEGFKSNDNQLLVALLMKPHYLLNRLYEFLFVKIHRLKMPVIDYSLSDVNGKIDWAGLLRILKSNGFSVRLVKYYGDETRLFSPFSFLLKKINHVNRILVVAKRKG